MIQQVDTPQNLYDYPCNIFVAGFIGSPQMNFLDGTLKKAGDQFVVDLAGTEVPLPKEKTADGKLDAYVGKTLKVGIRPEDIKDDEEFLEKHPNSHLSAEVEVSELMGAEIYLYLTYQGQNLMARVAPTSQVSPRRQDHCRYGYPQDPPVRSRDREDPAQLIFTAFIAVPLRRNRFFSNTAPQKPRCIDSCRSTAAPNGGSNHAHRQLPAA